MPKIVKTLRLESDLIEQAQALQLEGETDTALYTRLIQQGIRAYESAVNKGLPPLQADTQSGAQTSLVVALQAHICDLRTQIKKKDNQIEKINDALLVSQEQTKAAQVLQAAEKKSELLLVEPRKLTWKERITGKVS